MRFASVALLSGLISAVAAHFHLEYPGPRGPFVAANEVNFCGRLPEMLPSIEVLITFPR